MSDSQRIENLEWAVRRLTDEVASLRASLARIEGQAPVEPSLERRAAPAAAAASATLGGAEPPRRILTDHPPIGRYEPVSRGPAPGNGASAAPSGSGFARHIPHPASAADWEALVGRYGAMALAALTILLGVGAFIGWAVNHVQLGPEARVGLGALATAALAGLGLYLRQRGARSYGNTILALSLALAHVVAWGAGPYLGVIPVGVALVLADVASVALALLALREGEELLFVVGLGGSLIAPFVFHRDDGNLWALLGYGITVQIAGAHAIRGRDWRWAARTLAVGCALYALGAMAWVADHVYGRGIGTSLRAAPALFTLACIATTLIAGRGRRAFGIAASELVTLMVVLLWLLDVGIREPVVAALALAGTVAGYWTLAGAEPGAPRRAMATLVPVAFLGIAIVAPDQLQGITGALTALVWTGLALGAAWIDLGGEEELHLVMASLFGGGAVALGFHARETIRATALGLYGLAVALASGALRKRAPLVGTGWWLGVAWALALLQLYYRRDYQYMPFLTAPSAAMAVVVAGWVAAAWGARRALTAADERDWATLVGVIAGLVALAWGRQELGWAFSREIGVFFAIAYYALVGVGALFVGRARGSALLRRAGLGLAIYAALKSLVEAAALSAVALKVGSFLLVGAFLLGVAWLYRTAGEEPEAGAAVGA